MGTKSVISVPRHTQPEIGCRPTAWPACGRRLWPGGHPCLGLITGGPAADSSGHSSPRKTAVTTHTLAQKDVQLAAGKPFIGWQLQAESAVGGRQPTTADRRGKGKRPERLPSRGGKHRLGRAGGCHERKDHRPKAGEGHRRRRADQCGAAPPTRHLWRPLRLLQVFANESAVVGPVIAAALLAIRGAHQIS